MDVKKKSSKNKKCMTCSLVLISLSLVIFVIIFFEFKNHRGKLPKTVNNNFSTTHVSCAENSSSKTEEPHLIPQNHLTIEQETPVFAGNFSSWNRSCNPILVVINKDNPIDENYKCNIVDYKNVKINAAIKDDLDNMISSAKKDGINIYPSSGYRNIQRQTILFNRKASEYQKKGTFATKLKLKLLPRWLVPEQANIILV